MIPLPDFDETLPLATRTWGRAGGAPVLLIHGFGEGSHSWRRVERDLSPSHHGVTVDLRGHGSSPRGPAHHYRPAWYVADVLRLIDSWPVPPKAIVGHSLGAQVAIHVAARLALPDVAVAVVEGGPWLNPRASEIVRSQLSTTSWQYASVEDFEQTLLARHPLASIEDIRSFAASSLCRTPDGGHALRIDEGLKIRGTEPDDQAIFDAMAAIPGRILMVRGEISAITRLQAMRTVTQKLSNCRLVVVPLAGHAVMLDNPAACSAVLKDFLVRSKARPETEAALP